MIRPASSGAINAGKIASGNLLGQVITLASLLAITRLYSPEQFGLYAGVLAVANILIPVASLKLDSAVLLPRSADGTNRVLSVALASALSVGFFGAAIVYLAISLGALPADVSLLSVLLSGVMIAAGGTSSALFQFALREKRFAVIATRPPIQALSISAIQVGSGLFGAPFHTSLVCGQAAGRLAGIFPVIRIVAGRISVPSLADVRKVWGEYWKFPVIFTPSALLNAFGAQLPLFISIQMLGAQNVGGLALALQFSLAPVGLVASAIAQVFASEVAERVRENRGGVLRLFLKSSIRSVALSVVLFGVLFFAFPVIVPYVFGEDWRQASGFVRAVAPAACCSFVFMTVSRIFSVYAAAGASLVADLSRIIIVAVSGVAAINFADSPFYFAKAVYGGLALSYISSWTICLAVCLKNERSTD